MARMISVCVPGKCKALVLVEANGYRTHVCTSQELRQMSPTSKLQRQLATVINSSCNHNGESFVLISQPHTSTRHDTTRRDRNGLCFSEEV